MWALSGLCLDVTAEARVCSASAACFQQDQIVRVMEYEALRCEHSCRRPSRNRAEAGYAPRGEREARGPLGGMKPGGRFRVVVSLGLKQTHSGKSVAVPVQVPAIGHDVVNRGENEPAGYNRDTEFSKRRERHADETMRALRRPVRPGRSSLVRSAVLSNAMPRALSSTAG